MAAKEPKIVVVKMTPVVVSPQVAARLLDVSMDYMNKLLRKGVLESYKESTRRKVTVASIEEYVARRLAESAPKGRSAANLRPHEIPDWMEDKSHEQN